MLFLFPKRCLYAIIIRNDLLKACEKKAKSPFFAKKDVVSDGEKNLKKYLIFLLWIIEGIVVGCGAILPGLSGGALCAAFGMYRPIIEVLSDLRKNLKQHWLMLGFFFLGVAIGFVGLAGVTEWLMEKSSELVTVAFVGFIIGTLPGLFRDAGEEKRTPASYISMVASFLVLLFVLFLLKSNQSLAMREGFFAFLLCGLFWGLSFIVPGLSSSSLLLFFGLYQPMLLGIKSFDFSVLIPMGIGLVATVLLLSRVIGAAYKRYFSIVSHAVIGIVAATVVMIVPSLSVPFTRILLYIGIALCGAALSYGFTRLCDKIKEKQ